MAITITRAEVKRKCMIPAADTTYDFDIDALVAEMQPSIEYAIADEYLSDTGNTRLQATLKLGILEIVSGEFLQQLNRAIAAVLQQPQVRESLAVQSLAASPPTSLEEASRFFQSEIDQYRAMLATINIKIQ